MILLIAKSQTRVELKNIFTQVIVENIRGVQ